MFTVSIACSMQEKVQMVARVTYDVTPARARKPIKLIAYLKGMASYTR